MIHHYLSRKNFDLDYVNDRSNQAICRILEFPRLLEREFRNVMGLARGKIMSKSRTRHFITNCMAQPDNGDWAAIHSQLVLLGSRAVPKIIFGGHILRTMSGRRQLSDEVGFYWECMTTAYAMRRLNLVAYL